MAFALRYATRSLWRNQRRTLLTIGTVTLSVGVSIIATRYSTALLKIWADGSIDHGAGHAQVHVQGYYDHPDVLTAAQLLPADNGLEKDLRADPAVEAVTRRLVFEGIVSSGVKTIYFLGRGVDPGSERLVCPEIFHPRVDAGSFLPEDIPNGVVVGKGLAETLGVKVGDEIHLMAHTLAGGENGFDAIVAGIVDVPIPAFSKRLIYLRLSQVQAGIEAAGRYTELAIRLKPGRDPDAWVAANRSRVTAAGLDLRGWWEVEPMIRKVERIWSSVIGVISLLLFISAGISVLNIVFMLVAERTVEIGTLMAIGARGRDIRRLFTMEAALIGGLGGLAGALAGNLVILTMDAIGVPFDSPFSTDDIIVHPKVSLLSTAVIAGGAVLICYLSALVPSRKAARVEPVTAFRGQIT